MVNLSDRYGADNQSFTSLLTRDHNGSLTDYFLEMSLDALTLTPSEPISTKFYESDDDSIDDYVGSDCEDGWRPGVERFVREVIQEAEGDFDFTLADVGVVTPPQFGWECGGKNGTIFKNFALEDEDGNAFTVDGLASIEAVMTADYRTSMAFIVAVFAHEYGHIMGLPEPVRSNSSAGRRRGQRHNP